MGRGIAVVFAYAGHQVALVDFKPRDDAAFEKLSDDALSEVRNVLARWRASACSIRLPSTR